MVRAVVEIEHIGGNGVDERRGERIGAPVAAEYQARPGLQADHLCRDARGFFA